MSLPMQRMLLVLKRGPEQESALDTLLEQQQDASSPNYHKWLTPQQFGQQFGPSDQDIQTITSWLQSQGFQIDGVSNGRTVIEFSGNAGQVQTAFHTAIHKYTVNAEDHWANASDPEIPTALMPVVAGINSLHNFRKQAMHHVAGVFARSRETGRVEQVAPQFTFTCGYSSTGQPVTCYALAPNDFATIYNVLPLWNATSPMDGTGQKIAIVGRTNINLQDVSEFRNLFGLPSNQPQIILNGPDPGIVPGDETEADLDVEWSGAVAKGATIDLVVSQSTETSDGVDLSAEYIVDNNLAPVVSESYGTCELGLGKAGNQFENNLWQQAAAQGITVFVSSGDSGSAGCDRYTGSYPEPAQDGLQVNGLASTPYNVAVGGTDFNDPFNATTYWNSTSDPTTKESAKGYIPETTWNATCTNAIYGDSRVGFSTDPEANCNNSQLIRRVRTTGAGGGKSNCTAPTGPGVSNCAQGYPKPAWQAGTGVPNDGKRDVPDVSLFASSGFFYSFYMMCEADFPGSSGSCSTSNFIGIGGTSASSPAFAGIMALVEQKTGARQGNANYILYKLAGQQTAANCNSSTSPASTCVFNDVTNGTIAMPCATGSINCTTKTAGDQYGILSGYATTTGYDLATGLGSVNALNLVNNWTAFALTPSSTSLTLTFNGSNQINITHGQSVNVAINVTPPSGTVPPTGNVSLIADTAPPSAPAQVTQQGVQGFTLTSSTCSGSPCGTVTGTTNAMPGGTYDVVAQYAGDGTFGSSTSSPSSVTVAPEASKTSLGIVTFDLSTGQITSTNAATFPYGSPYLLRADVTNSSGSTCFNSTSATVSYACPTGAINLTDNSASLGGGTFALNSEGYAEYQAIQLNGGSHNLTASYGGDASYNASSESDAVMVTPAPTTTIILSPVSTTPPQNEIIGQPFTVFVQTQSSSSGVAPAGTYTLFDGTSQLAGTVSANGFTIPSSDQVFLNGSIQTSISGPSGSHNLTVHYSGDTNYASSVSSSVTLNALYSTTTALTVNPNNVILGNSVTLTATVSSGNPASNASLKPTGSISFNSNYGPVTGSVTTTVTQDSSGNWIVQASVTTTPQQSEVVSANFSGDSNYAASYQELGVNVTIPDFSISANSGSLTITAGQTGTTTLTITPATNYTSTVALSCPSAPFWGGTCTISPSSVTLSNGASATATLSLSSLAPSSNLTAVAFPSRMRRVPMLFPDRGAWWALSGAAGLASLLLFVLPGRRRSPRAAFGLALVGLLSFAVGCGGGASGNGGGGGGGGGPVPSSTTISASSTKIAQSSGLTLNSTVTSSGSFTGGVTFNSSCQYSQYAALTNGTAQIQVPPGSLGVGTCAFTAQYSGDYSHFPSQSGSLDIAVTGNASETVFAQTSTDVHSLQVNVTLQ